MKFTLVVKYPTELSQMEARLNILNATYPAKITIQECRPFANHPDEWLARVVGNTDLQVVLNLWLGDGKAAPFPMGSLLYYSVLKEDACESVRSW